MLLQWPWLQGPLASDLADLQGTETKSFNEFEDLVAGERGRGGGEQGTLTRGWQGDGWKPGNSDSYQITKLLVVGCGLSVKGIHAA